jgi:hypothetical protein
MLADTETNTKYRECRQPRASEAAGLLDVYVADSCSWPESGEGAVAEGQVLELWEYCTYCALDVYMYTVMGRSILAERGGVHYCTRPTGIQCRSRHECRRYDDELTWSKLHPPCMHASEEEEVGSWLADRSIFGLLLFWDKKKRFYKGVNDESFGFVTCVKSCERHMTAMICGTRD